MQIDETTTDTAIVTGASRGFGRAVTIALVRSGLRVVGVARDRSKLDELQAQLGDGFIPVPADAADPVIAGQLIDTYRPQTLVLNAGATPLSRPLHQHTWQSFSRNWDVDVQQVFHWTREALLAPLRPGSTVISFSSGAAVNGSPISGGYAGAKATIRFISSYAAEESAHAELGIRFVAVLPGLTPATDLGAVSVSAYARRHGTDVQTFLSSRGPSAGPEQVGQAVLELATDPALDRPAYLLGADGRLATLP
jgi:NAD(P)-dependent dehydrogenase (short-subunit alcohol dehydrogenase family)